jgi:protein AroM
MSRRLALITIGQSPRTDMAEMIQWLGSGVEIVEAGALDACTVEEIASMAPGPGDDPLVTRLRDGRAVTVGKRSIVDQVQRLITASEAAGADASLVVCTGDFPRFEHRRPLLLAGSLLRYGVMGIAAGSRVAVMCPVAEQVDLTLARWRHLTPDLTVRAASPYGDPADVTAAAVEIGRWGPEFVVLDCMGYTSAMKAAVAQATGARVLLARSVVGRLTAELLD